MRWVALLLSLVGTLAMGAEPVLDQAATGGRPAVRLSLGSADTVRFNGCSASYLRDPLGSTLGLVGAAHCVRDGSNVVRDSTHILTISRAEIRLDQLTDVFYVGLNGHTAAEVQAQLVENFRAADLRPGTPLRMVGYPSYHNPAGVQVELDLTMGGLVRWPGDSTDTIAALGDWNVLDQTCSPGASGSGLRVNGRVVAVLASRAEFVRVQTMPYSEEYGQELREYFAAQIGPIRQDFLCGFAPPTPGMET